MTLKDRIWAVYRTRKPVALLCAGVLLLGLIGIAWWGIRSMLDPYDCQMAPGVTVGGLDVGGMTKSQARKALKAALCDTLEATPLTVRLPEEDLILQPSETDVRIRIRKAVNTTYSCGRKDRPAPQNLSLEPFLKLDGEYIHTALTEYAQQWDSELQQHSWSVAGTQPELSSDAFDPVAPGQTLELILGTPDLHLDTAQVYDQILAAYGSAISLCANGDFSVVPDVVPLALPELPDLEAIRREISVEAENDSLDMEHFRFVHGSYGYSFDLKQAQAMVESADFGETVRIPLTHTKPEILGEEVYFRDILGSCETKHTDDENRNTNLRLLCAALDGVILQPGEEFSYNGTVGERTEAKGYKAATAYSGKRLIKDIGGGVCQGSTTLYNCALLADVEILERVCHGAKVGYIQLGLDAAVNWNTKTDLRFRNNFHFPMMIKAEVADGFVKMQILGTDEKDYYIEMRCSVGEEESVTYAVSYKCKMDKETGEQISKDLEARSAYYTLDG